MSTLVWKSLRYWSFDDARSVPISLCQPSPSFVIRNHRRKIGHKLAYFAGDPCNLGAICRALNLSKVLEVRVSIILLMEEDAPKWISLVSSSLNTLRAILSLEVHISFGIDEVAMARFLSLFPNVERLDWDVPGTASCLKRLKSDVVWTSCDRRSYNIASRKSIRTEGEIRISPRKNIRISTHYSRKTW